MRKGESQFSLVSYAKENKLNVFYVLLIFLNNFAYGMSVNIIGAVMVDLAIIYDTDLNTMCYIQVMVGIGYLIGSFASFLYRYIDRQLCLTFFVLLLAIIQVFLPAYVKLAIMFAMLLVNNIGAGAWDSSTSIWIVDAIPVGNAAFLQGNQMMYGLGSTLAPLMAAPFVYGDDKVMASNETLTTELRVHTLLIPFAINGVLQSIVPFIFLLSFFTCRYQKYDSSKKQDAEDDDDDKDSYYDAKGNPIASKGEEKEDFSCIPHRSFKLGLAALAASTYITAELGYLSFCAAMYQYLDIHLSASTSTQVQSVMSVTYTLGRLATAFISFKLKPDRILAYHYVILLASVALLVFGRDSLLLTYIGNATLGFGFSACWPGMFAFTEHYLRLTDKVCSLYAFLAGLISLVVPVTLAQVFSHHPLVLLYLTGGFIATSLVFFIIVRVWIAIDERKLGADGESKKKDDFYKRYSIAGPRLSMHFTSYKEDRARRKSMAPEWMRRQSQMHRSGAEKDADEYERRKSTISGKKKLNIAKLNAEELRRKSAPGFSFENAVAVTFASGDVGALEDQ